MSRFTGLRDGIKGVFAKNLEETINQVVGSLPLDTDKDEDTWYIGYGSAVVLIEIIGDNDRDGLLFVHAGLASLPKTNLAPLYRFLLEESLINTFDAHFFLLGDTVHIGSMRPIEDITRKDIESMLDTVATKADDYDDYLISEFGAIPLGDD